MHVGDRSDGADDYRVGTIEDKEETIHATFMLSLDSGGKDVTEIRISGGQGFCGFATQPSSHESSLNAIPIQITQRDLNFSLWGRVGDHKVCVTSDSVKERSILSDGKW